MALGALCAVLGACTPLYVPLVPEPPPFEAEARVAAGTAELDATGRPRLQLELAGVADAGWLAVQWMAPSGREAASQSLWADEESASYEFALPDDVELSAGEWRALVSLNGRLLRQFSYEVRE